jgi:hypothetical protein
MIANNGTGGVLWSIDSSGNASGYGQGKLVFSEGGLQVGTPRLAIASGGNIGIGTTGPAVALDVNGGIRAGSSTTVTTCNSSVEGTIRYNYTSHAMEYCNSTAWVPLISTQSNPAPTAPAGSGYFVLSVSTWNGNLGGIAGADAKCVTELTTNTGWMGYSDASSRGLLNSSHIHAFLTSVSGASNNLMPLTKYYYASAQSSLYGGAYFTTDSNGQGPGDSVAWSAANRFGSSAVFWASRGDASGCGNATSFGTSSYSCSVRPSNCQTWTSSLSSDIGGVGNTASTSNARWGGYASGSTANFAQDTCDTALPIVCFVNP